MGTQKLATPEHRPLRVSTAPHSGGRISRVRARVHSVMELLGGSSFGGAARRPPAAQDVGAQGADVQAEARLAQRALVALRLLARGYSPDRIAALQGVAPADTLWDLQRALTLLAASTLPEAIAEAKRRRLFD